ncbi:MAG: SusD/RagB family nutrient-binding outer membrane lipoprotein [Prevotellaceae bacterium]|jgi:hypothetical protein|nr:SusD/RagB family nutrient-binding outer membrane lipoprotein [Prevotellaceae bacterium]
MKKILIILLSSILVFSNTGCDSYLDVNKNVDAPDYVDDYLYLAGIEQSFQDLYYDIRALGPLTQMMGTTGYTSFANNYYSKASDAGGQSWRLYWLHGFNLENMINQATESERWTLAGMGYVIKAFTWDLLTKYHGDIPCKQAYIPGLLAHEYDSQEDVYTIVRGWAYKAIEYLSKTDNTNYGTQISSNDYIYGGDAEKWKKFAYAVLARNYISLSNKTDFVSSGIADSVIYCVQNSFVSVDDDATVKVANDDEMNTKWLNFWGVARANLSRSYFQHEYAVQIMTGTVPQYDKNTGNKVSNSNNQNILGVYPYELNSVQILADTIVSQYGHFDPRTTVLFGWTSPKYSTFTLEDTVQIINDLGLPNLRDTVRLPYIEAFPTEKDYILKYVSKRFYGGSFTNVTGPIGSAPSFYGRNSTSSTTSDGFGRWLYRNGAPYILTTFAEIKMCESEAYWKKGDKASALQALKDGISGHMDFCQKYIYPSNLGGDKITLSTFRSLADDYIAGPYVGGLTVNDLTLSHIMMQKWVTLYPWGAFEAWVDLRKYHYDIQYTGDYPSNGNGWERNELYMKWDTDVNDNPNNEKVYKGFYLMPANVEGRKSAYNIDNDGAPCYRIRPRYNSEYMWNLPSLKKLQPIPGDALNYHCSIPWFAYPEDIPTN